MIMDSRFFDPHSKLSSYIAGYVYWNDEISEAKEILVTVKGSASLAFPFHSNFKCSIKAQKLKNNPLSIIQTMSPVLVGQMTSFGKVLVEGHVQLIFVIFKPLGLNAFLRDDASTVTDSILSLGSFKEQHLKNLQNIKFEVSESVEQNILNLEKSLISCFKLKPNRNEQLALKKTLQFIVENKGKKTVQELAEWSGVSTRTLELQFKKLIGLPPKIYSRIIRFNCLIHQLTETPQIDSFEWIEKYGYTDQSHFIKDFKDFTGISPKKYFKMLSEDGYNPNKSISK